MDRDSGNRKRGGVKRERGREREGEIKRGGDIWVERR